MTEAIKSFTTKVFGSCPWLGVLLIAMVPIVELRGAIPFALSAVFWGAKVLPWWEAYLLAVVGSTIPALVIVPLLKPFFGWLKKTKVFRKMATGLENRFVSKSSKIMDGIGEEKHKRKVFWKKFIGVAGFVAVPLPLTGAWTGSAVASYLNLPFGWGVLAVFVGNIISGAIMTCICLLAPGAESIIMYVFLALAVLFIVGSIVYALIKKKKQDKLALAQETAAETDTVENKEQDNK